MNKIVLTDEQFGKVVAKCISTFHNEDHVWQTRFNFGGGVDKIYPHWECETLELALTETLGYDASFKDVDENQIDKITKTYVATFSKASREWYKEHYKW